MGPIFTFFWLPKPDQGLLRGMFGDAWLNKDYWSPCGGMDP